MAALQKIIPHLWYTREAEEAARFYASIFPDTRRKWAGLKAAYAGPRAPQHGPWTTKEAARSSF